ncbi:hypothetical protein MNBD_GAMMA23-220 [hydrothermal vent metagenome]|uniref:Thioredoxin domain-containing protein n=1 Tax=hydrothermal vent metagenome TaxID=652676 RepID=A0A3B0ZFA6_9ZZZZ
MTNTMTNLIRKILIALLFISSSQAYALSINQTAPDFTLPSSTKQNIRLAEQRGQVVMLNFWATWCNPCRVEIPHLQDLYNQYKDIGFTVIGVNIDNNKTKAAKMARDLGATFPILFDNTQTVSKLYSIKAMPFTLLIDRDGKIREIFYGYKPGYEKKYSAAIRKLLRE